MTPEEQAALRPWDDQQSLLTKLRVIADDARTYEQDTGVYVLDIGFPLLEPPPGHVRRPGRRRDAADPRPDRVHPGHV